MSSAIARHIAGKFARYLQGILQATCKVVARSRDALLMKITIFNGYFFVRTACELWAIGLSYADLPSNSSSNSSRSPGPHSSISSCTSFASFAIT